MPLGRSTTTEPSATNDASLAQKSSSFMIALHRYMASGSCPWPCPSVADPPYRVSTPGATSTLTVCVSLTLPYVSVTVYSPAGTYFCPSPP